MIKHLLSLLICLPLLAVDKKPNILYIFTDDQTHRSVSAYDEAHDWVQTPNIDKLAESGMKFTSCYTGAWCQPSRASKLTGLLQHSLDSLKITNYPMAEYGPKTLPFFPAVFRKNGYETACIGKWHLGDDVGHGRDWDYSVIWDRGGPKQNKYAYFNNSIVRTNGGERKPLGGYTTDKFTELAVDYINKQKDDEKPWYLWLCYPGVHGPYTPAERHKDFYKDVEVKVPSNIFGPRQSKPAHLKNMTRWKKDKNGAPLGFASQVKKYHNAVKSLDEAVGSLMKALKDSDQLENTVVIFTSDQGFAWGQHGSQEKWLPYDANILAPLIIRAPGITQMGTVSEEAVNGVDITVTIHDLAGIKPQWKMHGRSLMPLLKDPSKSLNSSMLMINTTHVYGSKINQELKAKNYDAFKRRGLYAWMMMRDGKYKYIRHFKDNVIEELYDLEKDPEELNNLAINPEYISKLKNIRAKTIEEFRRKDGDFIDLLPSPRTL